MVDLWRIVCRVGICHWRLRALHHDRRHSVRIAVLQAGRIDAGAIRKKDSPHAGRHGVSIPYFQYHLAHLRRIVYSGYTSYFCRVAMHHDHRHSVRTAASQINGAIADAIRKTGHLRDWRPGRRVSLPVPPVPMITTIGM